MRLAPGEKIKSIMLPAIDDTTFETESIKGKPFMLSFLRFASCPFCNLRVVISYSPEGFVFVHMMANNRTKHSVSDLFGGENSEIKDSATTHISYCGTYEIEENEVLHYVSVSSFPNWVPSE